MNWSLRLTASLRSVIICSAQGEGKNAKASACITRADPLQRPSSCCKSKHEQKQSRSLRLTASLKAQIISRADTKIPTANVNGNMGQAGQATMACVSKIQRQDF
eukprot:1156313-Pelagomonas_calceolata.AAC.7